jgi:hypothetical protein
MLDLVSMPRGVRDQLAMLDIPAGLILCAATFSPWDGTVTVELQCEECGEKSTVTGDPFAVRWAQRVDHECPRRQRAA